MNVGIIAQQMVNRIGPPPLPVLPYADDITHWFRSSNDAYSDLSNTPASIGNTVAKLRNLAANGVQDAIQTTESLRLTYANGHDGIPCLRTAGGDYFQDLDISFPTGTLPAQFPLNLVWAFVFDVPAHTTWIPFTGISAGNGGSKGTNMIASDSNFWTVKNDYATPSPRKAIVVRYADYSIVRWCINGVNSLISSSVNSPTTASSTTQFLRNSSMTGGGLFIGDFYEAITWGGRREMTAEELKEICDTLNDYYNFY